MSSHIQNLIRVINSKHLRREGVSNDFLCNMIKCMNITSANFTGVHSPQEWAVPSNGEQLTPYYSVINIKMKNHVGHFIVLITFREYFLYLDPFGLPPITQELKNKTDHKPLFFNIKCIQSANSSYCGLYCLFFIASIFCKTDDQLKYYKFADNDSDSLNESRCLEYLYLLFSQWS